MIGDLKMKKGLLTESIAIPFHQQQLAVSLYPQSYNFARFEDISRQWI